ncbi:MAG TPA: hypothetical protein VHB68_02375, partial [Steroidobacteraceae bacterium]|nr:hypothetical protein [Steroidobacteraceae bacterium]
MLSRLLLAIATLAALAGSPARADDAQRFAVISSGERVGELQVRRAGHRLTIDYHIDDNGRGPRTHEVIELGADGMPLRWHISGRGETGVAIQESFERSGRDAHWRTRNDAGDARVEAGSRPLYLAQGASPFAYGLYGKALRAASGHELATLPAGSVRAEPVPAVSLQKPEVARSATVWALWGTGTSPKLVMLGADGDFLGVLDTSRLVIPEAWLTQQGELVNYAAAVDRQLLLDLSRKLVHRWDVPIHLRNVHVLDPQTGTVSDARTVVVFRGRISEVMSPDEVTDTDAVTFDGDGGVVVPALYDMHAHLSAWDAPLYIAAGITTVRDMGNDNSQLLALTSEIDAGRIAGPRVVASGFLEGRSPYSARDGFVVSSLSEALRSVQWYGERGYWQIKLYNSIAPEWIAPLAVAAHRLGMRVAGHVPAFTSSERAIRDGYDEITHLNQLLLSLMIDTSREDTRTPFRFTALGQRTATLDLEGRPFQDLLALMKEHHTALDPTAAILSEMLLGRAGETTPVDAPWIDHMPAPVQRVRRSAMLEIAPSDDARYRQSEKRLLAALRVLHEAGIRILPGTDDAPG